MKPFVSLATVLFLLLPTAVTAQTKTGGSGTIKRELPGLQTGPAPWSNGTDRLTERLDAIGLPALPSEGTELHTHQQLKITIQGKPVTVPAGIGINRILRYISPLHTHDSTGAIHIESATKQAYTLGQFFDVWGVRLTAQCIGGYCANGQGRARGKLSVTSNGRPVEGDPRALLLEDHQTIVVSFGAAMPADAGTAPVLQKER